MTPSCHRRPLTRIALVLVALAAASTSFAATDRLRVNELFLRCLNGSRTVGFVELIAEGPGQTFDASVGVRFLSNTGAMLYDVRPLFASQAGQPWPEGSTWLIGMSGFQSATGVSPDFVASVLPSAGAGSIVLYRRDPSTQQESVLHRLDYGFASPSPPIPPNGRSLLRQPNGTYAVQITPGPTNFSGTTAFAADCFGGGTRPIRVGEVQFRCFNGTIAGQFIELASVGTTSFDADLGVRAFDRNGQPLFDLTSLFGQRVGQTWQPYTNWLIGTSTLVDYQSHPPDAVLPTPLDTLAGRIQVYGRDSQGALVVLHELVYGPGGIERPAQGLSLAWFEGSGFVVPPAPTPIAQSGLQHQSPLCVMPLPSEIRIQEVQLRCQNRLPTGRFIQLQSVVANEQFDPRFSLRVYDHEDVLIGEMNDFFGVLRGKAWGSGKTFLIASPDFLFQGLSGPDAILPFAPDTLGGRIVLYGPDANDVVAPLRELRYGAGGVPVPAPGHSLRRLADDSYVEQAVPSPKRYNGSVLTNVLCSIPVPTSARIDEVQFGCSNGNALGQFIELVSTRANERFDAQIVLRIFDRNDLPLTEITNPFGARAGQPWLLGSSWLIATSGYEDGSRGTADRLLTTVLDPVAGRLVLLGPDAGGQLITVQDLRYGTPERPAPPLGGSLQRVGEDQYVVATTPSPLRSDGVTLFNSRCLAPAFGEIRFSEVMIACESGATGTSFIELVSTSPLDFFERGVRLVVLDHADAVLFEIHDPFGPLAGSPWPQGRTFLLANSGFSSVTSSSPDAPLPSSLDAAGGTLRFEGTNLLGTSVVTELRYGPSGIVPAPMPGRSIQRHGEGAYDSNAGPTPRKYDGFEPRSLACFGSADRPIRISEALLQCMDGGPAGQFIQLVAAGPSQSRDGDLRLRIYDRNETLVAEMSNPFGASVGSSWPQNSTWLIAGPNYAGSPNSVPDAMLPTELDTTAGRIVVIATASGAPIVLHELRYGHPGTTPVPDYGSGLRWDGASGFVEAVYPDPRNHLGSFVPFPGCLRSIADGIRISEASLACLSGHPAGQFVELMAVMPHETFSSELYLRAYNRAGARELDLPIPFGSRADTPWPVGSTWLIGSPLFRNTLYGCADSEMPRYLDQVAGRLELVRVQGGVETIVTTLPYGTGGFPAPPNGMSLESASGPAYLTQPRPSPTCSRGLVSRMPCLDQGAEQKIVVHELGLRCRDGQSSAFFELTSASNGQLFDPRIGMRAFDRNGQQLWDRPTASSLFGLWRQGLTWLVATGAFQSRTGVVPDMLVSSIDSIGGAVELYFQPSIGDRIVFNRFQYGPGTNVPVPAAGSSAQRLADGTYATNHPPSPTRWTGESAWRSDCASGCRPGYASFQGVKEYRGGSRWDLAIPLASGSRDLALGRFTVQTSNTGELRMTNFDDFTVLGPAGTTLSFEARLQFAATIPRASCPPYCELSQVDVYLERDGITSNGYTAFANAQGSISVPVQAQVGVPFALTVAVASKTPLNGWLPDSAAVVAQLDFTGLPTAVAIQSCGGFFQGSPVPAQISLVESSAEPGLARLVWYSDAGVDDARVERREESTAWARVGDVTRDGTGYLRFEDRDIEPGRRYAYRLAWAEEGVEHTSGAAWVEIPAQFQFALHGLVPNPTDGRLSASLELASEAPVRIECLDIAGRRVLDRRLTLRPGRHALEIAREGELPAGFYVVRLTQGSSVATKRAIVAR